MKTASTALQNLFTEYMLGKRRTWYIAELYMFKLSSGQTLLYTGHDTTLSIGGNIYEHWPIDHGDITEERGIKVSDTTIDIYFNPFDKITGLGVTWYQALQSGAFDDCTVSIDRLYSPDPWSYIMPNISSNYVLKGRFVGRMDTDELRFTSATLTVKSALELLNTQLPRNLMSPSCLNTFGDFMCGINKENLGVTFTAQAGSSKTSIVSTSTGSGYYTQGTIVGITGANIGVTRTVKVFTSGVASLFHPFNLAVSVGDTFRIYPGCSKTITACQGFNNLARFRGMPFIPVPETLL
ncbi:MAG: hypothetical protein K0Q53_67 [Massilibacillus sp.]|jgi:uncharacterized phage protein (TIGR02218 family)|nr:hypothetical protein [Massilibacillus sp.]